MATLSHTSSCLRFVLMLHELAGTSLLTDMTGVQMLQVLPRRLHPCNKLALRHITYCWPCIWERLSWQHSATHPSRVWSCYWCRKYVDRDIITYEQLQEVRACAAAVRIM